jgi:release factor glutamine methyltransferase
MATAVRTVGESVRDAASQLARTGIDTARLDAEILVGAALGVSRERVHLDSWDTLTPESEAEIARLVARRAEREPVAYILGRRAFRRLDLEVDPRVLIPRPETELLVEIALELPQGARVHDVGTGSGAVALGVADERPDLRVSASDASSDAIAVAQANADRLGLEVSFVRAPGFPPAAEDADLVVANLPYVREDEWETLAPEITRHEPRFALVAGPRGLEAIEEVVAAAPAGTALALEHAPPQAEAVRQLLQGARTHRDLAGHERVTTGRVP